jgi:hypothetical protein
MPTCLPALLALLIIHGTQVDVGCCRGRRGSSFRGRAQLGLWVHTRRPPQEREKGLAEDEELVGSQGGGKGVGGREMREEGR